MNKTGYWPVHAEHQPAVRPGRSAATCCSRRAGGWTTVFARHQRWGEGVRAAVQGLGPGDPVRRPGRLFAGADRRDDARTASTPTRCASSIYERFDCSLGTGLGKVKGKMFRIGHLGDCNDLTLMATLAGCEMGLKLAGVKLAGFRRAGRHGIFFGTSVRRQRRWETSGIRVILGYHVTNCDDSEFPSTN